MQSRGSLRHDDDWPKLSEAGLRLDSSTRTLWEAIKSAVQVRLRDLNYRSNRRRHRTLASTTDFAYTDFLLSESTSHR